MKMRTEFIADCLHLLNISKPLDLKVTEVINNWDASYEELERRHVVKVSPRAERCQLALVAHELVHAAIVEKYRAAPDHGRAFQRTATRLQSQLRRIGWELKDKIFIQGVDK